MTRQRLPTYLNRFPDGRLTLTCAHCAIDADLEGAEPFALFAEERPGGGAISWEAELTAEQVIAAAAAQCMHLAAYRASPR
jgi:hypothetical protein